MTPIVLERWTARVRERLEAQDAELELWHLARMSPEEVEVLVRLERTGGLGGFIA